MTGLGFAPFTWAPILLPIGLSFFIFHAISYLVDIYRKEEPPTRNLLDFAAFIALFPHLIAGPVLKYNLLADQFLSRTHTLEKFSYGATRFMTGFAKKVLIADTIAPLVTATFNQTSPSFFDSWLGALAYTLQLYFDFSGYSDMAIGLAAMMGFKFPENFNHPYISRSITEFWRRWHMSLSSWLREYLYIGLGGNRKGRARTYVNLALTMVLGGLWHGANWTFILWGTWHGGILALERRMKEAKLWQPRPAWLTIPGTMLLVILGWVMFRADNVPDAFRMYRGMLGLNGVSLERHARLAGAAQRTDHHADRRRAGVCGSSLGKPGRRCGQQAAAPRSGSGRHRGAAAAVRAGDHETLGAKLHPLPLLPVLR